MTDKNKTIVKKVTNVLEELFCKQQGCLEFLNIRKVGGIDNPWYLINYFMHPSKTTKTCMANGIGIDVHLATDGEHLIVTEFDYYVKPEFYDEKKAMNDIITQMEQGFFLEI